jgi:acyl-coenzyme A thioesterase PaaI-like protein
LADHALGNVARASVDGRATATIQMDVQFVAAGRLGDFLVAQSSVVRTTRSIVFMRGEIHAGDRLIATASGLWKALGA